MRGIMPLASHYANETQRTDARIASQLFSALSGLGKKNSLQRKFVELQISSFFNHAILQFCKRSLMREHRSRWFT